MVYYQNDSRITSSATPERIWAFEPDIFDNCSLWQDQPSPKGDTKEYILMDAHRAEVKAAVKRALEGAAGVANSYNQDPYPQTEFDRGWACSAGSVCEAIRALDPAQFVDGET